MAHNLVVSMPGLKSLRKFGTVAANHDNALLALQSGAALLVYPGGDYEVFRPSWKRHQVDFGGRKGYVKLAREAGVPIVPVASVGGQEAALFLDRGQWLAKLLMVDKIARLKSVPILLAPPWGLVISDMIPRLRLKKSPAKAQRTFAKVHDAAVKEYGEGERAHRVAYDALKHSFEKVGDHWEAQGEEGAVRRARQERRPERQRQDRRGRGRQRQQEAPDGCGQAAGHLGAFDDE